MKYTQPSEETPRKMGMGGTSRMHDPTEAHHDRVRRTLMNISFVLVVLVIIVQWKWVGISSWDWLSVVFFACAAIPSGLVIKIFELRFKMSRKERRTALRDISQRKQIEFVAYSLLTATAFSLNPPCAAGGLFGIWFYDFVTYYHNRQERIRHLYAITKILDELRDFKIPWIWPIPSLILEVINRLFF